MTWIGKILTVMVSLLALVWVYLTAQAYATRTNWKNEADKWKAAYNEIAKAREADYRTGLSDKANLDVRLAAANKQVTDLDGTVNTLRADLAKNLASFKELNEKLEVVELAGKKQKTVLDAALEEDRLLRLQLDKLQDDRVKLTVARETAEREKLQAEIVRNTLILNNDRLQRQVETLTQRVETLRANGGREDAVQSALAGRTAVPENVRGTVTRVDGDLVELSIGLDAGVGPGAVLDLYRTAPNPKYLGTVVVGVRAEPKRAVAQFHAAGRGKPRPDELPRVGDEVGVLGKIGGGR